MGDLDKIGTAIDNAETPEEASLIAIVVETAIALLDAMDVLDANLNEDVGGDNK